MKKLVLLFAACLMVIGCEKDVIGEGYPEMEGFYIESCGLPSVTIDSVKSFTIKVNDFTTENPEKFKEQAQIFLHETVEVGKITLEH